MSPPSDSRPETLTPGGMSSCARTLPLCGSMRRISLSSPSQVACDSSPSTHVTPVTKRSDSQRAQDRASLGINLWILRARCCPTHSVPSAHAMPEGAAVGRRDGRNHAAGLRIDRLDAVAGDLVEEPAVESGPRMGGDVELAHCLAVLGDRTRRAPRRSRSRHGRRCSSRRRRGRRPAPDASCSTPPRTPCTSSAAASTASPPPLARGSPISISRSSPRRRCASTSRPTGAASPRPSTGCGPVCSSSIRSCGCIASTRTPAARSRPCSPFCASCSAGAASPCLSCTTPGRAAPASAPARPCAAHPSSTPGATATSICVATARR